ncbi:discoidin domain-containing protein [Microbacterium sp. NPDC056234]|uniref:discoidin domain-containing protein n=1 Tax=Microbacterium sp. NPDC056234 TaxID=3345757 RepID=UPI0035E21D28
MRTPLSRSWNLITASVAATAMLLGGLVPSPASAASEEQFVCEVTFTESTSDAGFSHPGIGVTPDQLRTVQEQVAGGTEPWASYFADMAATPSASLDVVSSNRSSADPTKPDSTAFSSQGFNSRFIADGLKSYTQSLMWVITGDTRYRDNALAILRIWEQMNPAEYQYFTDSHIHTGVPMYRMTFAAELLRYTSCDGAESVWTDADTDAYSANLARPVIETFQNGNGHFMNQHTYPLQGAMAGAIFLDDEALYDRSVEWFTVNSSAPDRGFNGSIERLFRLVDRDDRTGEPIDEPRVQHVEMGRDQAHGGGDLINATMLSRMMMTQGTKVDPVDGTVSDAADAVGPYEFLDDRILAAADYFWKYMLGYTVDWTPVGYAISLDGTVRDTYNFVSSAYRGRYNTAGVWDLYYYYKYVRGENVEEIAPYLAEGFSKRLPLTFYYGGNVNRSWESPDGGGDFWLTIPEEAAGSSIPHRQADATRLEFEDRYTQLTAGSNTIVEGDTGFVRLLASEEGTRVAYLTSTTTNKLVSLRVRTDGVANLRLEGGGLDKTMVVPDTDGQWRSLPIALSSAESWPDLVTFTAKGDDTAVDIDQLDIAAASHSDALSISSVPATVIGVVGATTTIEPEAEAASDSLEWSGQGDTAGVQVDSDTGTISWTPSTSGEQELTVVVDDGESIVARNVKLVSADTRDGALSVVDAAVLEEAAYETASWSTFTPIRDEAHASADGDTDEEFATVLSGYVDAAAALKLLSPRTPNGSLEYASVVASSTVGADIGLLVDESNLTGISYRLAPDLQHTFDFGPDFRVSASEFGFSSNIFPDRTANAAVFGSDDGVEWTRLTPGATRMTQDYQTLEVSEELRTREFRYIRAQILESQPDVLYGIVRNFFEMTEFHIYGDRHESGNGLESVSVSSESATAGKIALGDTVDVAITSRDALTDVTVSVQGVSAEATSEDGLSWHASVALDDVEAGDVRVRVEYTDASGQPGPVYYGTSDGSALFIAGDRQRQIDVSALATVTASAVQWPGNGLGADEVGALLFDGDPATAGDLNTASGSYYVLDFGDNALVAPEQILFLPRAGASYTRANGTVVQVSSDGTEWTDLTDPVTGAADGRWIVREPREGGPTGAFRYVRIINESAWSGNLAEVEIYGALAFDDAFIDERVRDTSAMTRASAFLYAEEIASIRADLASPDADRAELLQRLIAADGILVPATELLPKIEVQQSGVTSSSASWDGTRDAAANGWAAFDGDPATSPDTKAKSGWVSADLGEGAEAVVGLIKYLPRAGGANPSRMNGAYIEASSDGESWTRLWTFEGVTTAVWGEAAINDPTPYRYIRYVSPTGFANVAEIELLGKATDITLVQLLIERAEDVDVEVWTEESIAWLRDAQDDAESLIAATVSQVDVDAAAERLRAALDALEPASSPAAWKAGVVYDNGDVVRDAGVTYVAQWWTQDEPGGSAWGSWMERGVVQVCGAEMVRSWTPSWVYNGGEKVVRDGRIWEAAWWTRNQVPVDQEWGPWKPLQEC